MLVILGPVVIAGIVFGLISTNGLSQARVFHHAQAGLGCR